MLTADGLARLWAGRGHAISQVTVEKWDDLDMGLRPGRGKGVLVDDDGSGSHIDGWIHQEFEGSVNAIIGAAILSVPAPAYMITSPMNVATSRGAPPAADRLPELERSSRPLRARARLSVKARNTPVSRRRQRAMEANPDADAYLHPSGSEPDADRRKVYQHDDQGFTTVFA